MKKKISLGILGIVSICIAGLFGYVSSVFYNVLDIFSAFCMMSLIVFGMGGFVLLFCHIQERYFD